MKENMSNIKNNEQNEELKTNVEGLEEKILMKQDKIR